MTELTDETLANDLPKEAVRTHQSASSNKMSRQANRHGSSRTANELTLPPIVETQVSSSNNQNVNNSKKSNSSNRVDSGIAIDYPSDNHQVGWTLSPNGSDNGADNHRRESVTTTLDIVENNLKKKYHV